MSWQRLFRVIGRVLDPGKGIAFEGLAGTRQFFDAFVAGFLDIRQAFGTSGLPRAVWPYLSGIVAQFVEPRLVVTFEFRIAFRKPLLRKFSLGKLWLSFLAVVHSC